MIKIPHNKISEKHGKEYYIQYKHRTKLWEQYKISYPIDNEYYGLKTYEKLQK